MLSIREFMKGTYGIIPRTEICKVFGYARWGGMLSLRECVKGRYVTILRTQISKVLEGMQDREVWLALGSV